MGEIVGERVGERVGESHMCMPEIVCGLEEDVCVGRLIICKGRVGD